jgi:hypothetical protein
MNDRRFALNLFRGEREQANAVRKVSGIVLNLIPPYRSLSTDKHRGLAAVHKVQQQDFLKRIVNRPMTGIFMKRIDKPIDPEVGELTMRDLIRGYKVTHADDEKAPLFLGVDQKEAAAHPTVTFLVEDSDKVDSFFTGCMITLTHRLPQEHIENERSLERFARFFTKDAVDARDSQDWDMSTDTFSTHQDMMLEELGESPILDLTIMIQNTKISAQSTVQRFMYELHDVDEASSISYSVRTHNTTESIASTQAGSYVEAGDPMQPHESDSGSTDGSNDEKSTVSSQQGGDGRRP